ncbi:cation diffusion facilitator family transporter [Rossellomorea marisflavi]|uniref:cation diffusion facilitator family transporter n=1 Tax=Rossellomorea marisflavi TaxID=189381 RepID=UPI00064EA96B|nr:cation diffusion facilitator family transporter [Rossellomorea marisflavi]KML34902.1 cation transporter [Rossellomorea marisflavi]USK91442.1 cation diffusion facilitator family transporter [Rossellomorea marisflavi]
MAHDHSDHTHHANTKTMLISFIIITVYMVVEAIGGYVTNSLALLSDAGHMLSDSLSLGIALIAFKLGEKAATYRNTFGYKRFEIIAATLNGLTLIGIALFIFYEAIKRFTHPPEVATSGMLIISIIGLLVNVLVAWIMMRGGDTDENLNMRGAFLHVISDMLGSVGAVIAALLIMFFGWGWADPLASVIVAVLVLNSGYRVVKKSLHILLEGTPEQIDVEEVIDVIKREDGIDDIHDLHIWTITSGFIAMSCHAVVAEDLTVKGTEQVLRRLEPRLQHFGIKHITMQFETENNPHDSAILCDMEHGHEH